MKNMPTMHYLKSINSTISCTIYSLANPETGNIFYIGATFNPKAMIIAHTRTFGFIPVMEVVEVYSRNSYHAEGDTTPTIDETEAYWIRQFTAWGFKLTNVVHVNNKKRV